MNLLIKSLNGPGNQIKPSSGRVFSFILDPLKNETKLLVLIPAPSRGNQSLQTVSEKISFSFSWQMRIFWQLWGRQLLMK